MPMTITKRMRFDFAPFLFWCHRGHQNKKTKEAWMFTIDKNSSVGLRLAYRFWIELGRPTRFNNRKTMEEWAPKMESLFHKSGVDYAGFKWFLIWALRLADPDGARYGNDFTARNLRAAHDPMASLVKQ